MPTIRVGLYHVAVRHDPPKTVREVIATVIELPNDGSRARTISENEPVRPRKLNIENDYCWGEFTRIKVLSEMPLSNAAGKEDTLKFAPGDPTPCDHTAFLFDYESSVLHRGAIRRDHPRIFRKVHSSRWGSSSRCRHANTQS